MDFVTGESEDNLTHFQHLCVIPVHVQLVAVEDIRRLVDVLDGEPDRGHDTPSDFPFSRSGSHGEKCGKINISPGKKL